MDNLDSPLSALDTICGSPEIISMTSNCDPNSENLAGKARDHEEHLTLLNTSNEDREWN